MNTKKKTKKTNLYSCIYLTVALIKVKDVLFYADDDDDSLPPNRLCFVNKDFNTPFSCSITRILKRKKFN